LSTLEKRTTVNSVGMGHFGDSVTRRTVEEVEMTCVGPERGPHPSQSRSSADSAPLCKSGVPDSDGLTSAPRTRPIHENVRYQRPRHEPPKNGEIALGPNTRVVKCKYYVSQKQNGFNNKIQWYSILLTFISKFTTGLMD